MKSRLGLRRLLVAVLAGLLIGGGLMAVTPAGAEVAQAAATNWKKIWKKNLRPQADKRYYTKRQSRARFQPKGAYEPAGSGYTKAESDAKYAGAGSSYTKAESDAKYVAKPALITGGFYQAGYSEGGSALTYVIDFGATLSAPPTPHYVESGAVPPPQCPGTAAVPAALPGHLCVFETGSGGLGAGSLANFSGSLGATEPTGATVFALMSGVSVDRWMRGRWAVRPLGYAAQGAAQPAPSGAGPAGVGGSR